MEGSAISLGAPDGLDLVRPLVVPGGGAGQGMPSSGVCLRLCTSFPQSPECGELGFGRREDEHAPELPFGAVAVATTVGLQQDTEHLPGHPEDVQHLSDPGSADPIPAGDPGAAANHTLVKETLELQGRGRWRPSSPGFALRTLEALGFSALPAAERLPAPIRPCLS